MIITKWFREWREFVAEQKIRREEQLKREVNELITTVLPEYVAHNIIDHVRYHDRHRY